MRLIMLGPPGAGKGTQGEMLAQVLRVPRIATGDIFREAVKDLTDLGRTAKFYIERGELVPDEIVVGIVLARILKPDCERGFLLDGFPRTVGQAEELDEILVELRKQLDGVLLFEIDFQVLLKRLTGRRVCTACGASFHVQFLPPREPERCDKCSGTLIQREDDQEATVRHRLDVHERRTKPLKTYYKRRNLLYCINADQPKDTVFRDILRAIGREPA